MAQPTVETVNTGAEKAKYAIVAALVVVALAAYYFLAKQGAYAQWGALLAGLAAAAGVMLTSDAGKTFVGFMREAWKEVKKVVWPERQEAMQLTLYVLSFAVVMALFLWLTDKSLEWLLYDLILGWRK